MSHSRLTTHRVLAAAVAAATVLSACSSTNDTKAGDDNAALDASPGASAEATPELVGEDGEPLTKEEIVAAVESGELPKSALAAVETAPDQPPSGGKSEGSAPADKPADKPAAKPGTKPASGPVGPGVTPTTIKIGFSTFKVGDAARNFGINLDLGDNEAQANAVIKYLNDRGGIAGRKVLPSFYEVDFSGQAGVDGQLEAAACEKWTEDDKVFAAVNASLQRQQLLACLAKKDVVGIHDGLQIDEARMSPYRQWYYTTKSGAGVIQDRAARTETKMLCDKGWFKGATVGIIYFDEAAMRTIVDKTYEPAMKACGAKKLVKQAAPRGLTTSDSTYVSRFQREGVTNVMFLGEGGNYPFTFMPAAENQLYRPKYAVRSDHGPAVQLQTQNVPPEQLRNAIGIGWSPLQDVDAGGDPGANAADVLCLEIFKKAGLPMNDRGARFVAMTYCGGLLFLHQAMAKAPSVTSAGLASVVKGLGTSFVSPGAFTCTFTASQHDCPSTYRELAYDFGKKAFRYTSGNKAMSTG